VFGSSPLQVTKTSWERVPVGGRLAGRHLELTELLHLARTQRVSEQTDNQPEGT
jgi:hypothetical protein